MSQDFHDTQSKLALVALGGNSGSTAGGPYETVHAALAQLKRYFNDVATSGFYQTPAFPAGSGPDFVNAACSFETELSPSEILAHLHRIESDFGRTRTQRWGQRTLDLDLIACEEHVLPDHAVFQQWHDLPPEVQMTTTPETLILPHPWGNPCKPCLHIIAPSHVQKYSC